MTVSVQALLLFTGWTFLLVLIVFAYRGVALLSGTSITSWPRGSKNANDPGFIQRVADAHANTLENLPIFAVLVLYARIAQSAVHIAGVNTPLVLARATFWTVQLVCFGLMFYGLLA